MKNKKRNRKQSNKIDLTINRYRCKKCGMEYPWIMQDSCSCGANFVLGECEEITDFVIKNPLLTMEENRQLMEDSEKNLLDINIGCLGKAWTQKMVNKKKYGVGKRLRDELDKLNNTFYENLFIPKIMEDLSQKFASAVDDGIYEALRTKIEFTITQFSDSRFDIKIKDVFQVDEKELNIFRKEMELNLREQYGNTK